MPEFNDGYDSYYANRLWQLLPGVYRARDRDDPAVSGPLEELVGRIGAQAAVVRRSIDRLWADQSIETCDDWVIPYIADLLGTKLVSGLDARGQRLDVAKTIHYRRRKGTLAVLEELARDVTGWEAHVVESFRRLSRTRHSLDPPVGSAALSAALALTAGSKPATGALDPRELLRDQGLVGRFTGTLAGGFADLRSPHGASLAGSPFDEFFHTAELRRGPDISGRYCIPNLLVFLWRLGSFRVAGSTPVPVSGAAGTYAFDPTGRRIPLFMRPLGPEPDDWADAWTSAAEWQVPGPLSSSLVNAIAETAPDATPYPAAAGVPALYEASAGTPLEPVEIIACTPEAGLFSVTGTPAEPFLTTYQYGLPGAIGAGAYDRTLFGDPPAQIDPEQPPVSGGAGLGAALAASGGTGTVTIADSRTYADVGSTAMPVGSLLVRGDARCRPVVRLPAGTDSGAGPVRWVFTGGGPGSELILDGLLISGGDIVLQGPFGHVRLTACTVDPGSLATAGALAMSVDGRPLAPARVWVEPDPGGAPGGIAQMTVDNCLLGPIRTRSGGAIETLTISDSIVQGIDPVPAGVEPPSLDVYDPELLLRGLSGSDPVARYVVGKLSTAAQSTLAAYAGGTVDAATLSTVAASLDQLVTAGTSIYSEDAFQGVPLDPGLAAVITRGGGDAATINHALLEAAFPVALSPAALAVSQGVVALERATVLGRAFAHRLSASDSILSGFAVAEDTQDGGVRFSAVASGSCVPRQYRSVTLEPGASLFTSVTFGGAGFGQLLDTADRAVAEGSGSSTITAGAESGSEMGAFSSHLAPIKQRGLLAKYDEYMPLGLSPVVVHVT